MPKTRASPCLFRSRTFVLASWMCMKQTSVSHSSTESTVISLDAGSRMDGIPVLDLWDLVVEVLHFPITPTPTHQALRNQCRGEIGSTNSQTKLEKKAVTETSMNCQTWITLSQTEVLLKSQLKTFEDNELVIKMILKGKKSYCETRVQNPQSCVRLVVWRSQFGLQNPNQIC